MSTEILRKGQDFWVFGESMAVAMEVAACRNKKDASRTRGATKNKWMHEIGCVGEVAVRRMLGILEPPKCLDKADKFPDITTTRPQIEVKCGRHPLAGRHAMKPFALYIYTDFEWTRDYGALITIKRMAFGTDVDGNEVSYELPRAGTRRQNWEIPDELEEMEIDVSAK